MAGDGLLDTSAVIAVFRPEAAVISHLSRYAAPSVPTIVIGELQFGAQRSGRRVANLVRIEEYVSDTIVLECGRETARIYGRIKDGVRAKGRPIPDNDLWIAAVAIEHDLTLITRDSHFREIDGLALDFLPMPLR